MRNTLLILSTLLSAILAEDVKEVQECKLKNQDVCGERMFIQKWPESCTLPRDLAIACQKKCGGPIPARISNSPCWEKSTSAETGAQDTTVETPVRRKTRRNLSDKPKAECGWRGGPQCGAGFECKLHNPDGCKNDRDCRGSCVRKLECGSRSLGVCKDGFNCVKAPGARCGPEADCGGICVKSGGPRKNPHVRNEESGSLKERQASPAAMGMKRPAASSCSSNSACPGSQSCLRKRSILEDGKVTGQCIGQTCYLAPKRDSDKKPCPNGQVCVRKPCKGVKESPTDLPGLCASRDMTCRSDSNCPQGWMCQKHANGEGALCASGDRDCGLCIHYGDGKCPRFPG